MQNAEGLSILSTPSVPSTGACRPPGIRPGPRGASRRPRWRRCAPRAAGPGSTSTWRSASCLGRDAPRLLFQKDCVCLASNATPRLVLQFRVANSPHTLLHSVEAAPGGRTGHDRLIPKGRGCGHSCHCVWHWPADHRRVPHGFPGPRLRVQRVAHGRMAVGSSWEAMAQVTLWEQNPPSPAREAQSFRGGSVLPHASGGAAAHPRTSTTSAC